MNTSKGHMWCIRRCPFWRKLGREVGIIIILINLKGHFVVLGARGFARGGGGADLDRLLPRSSSGGKGLHWGGESALGMTKDLESLHYRFTTLIAFTYTHK